MLVGSPLFRAQADLSMMSQQWSPAEAVLSPGHTGKKGPFPAQQGHAAGISGRRPEGPPHSPLELGAAAHPSPVTDSAIRKVPHQDPSVLDIIFIFGLYDPTSIIMMIMR